MGPGALLDVVVLPAPLPEDPPAGFVPAPGATLAELPA